MSNLYPSSRAEGLLFLHGLESNPGSSLQTEEEAGEENTEVPGTTSSETLLPS